MDMVNYWQVFEFDDKVLNFLVDETMNHMVRDQDLLECFQKSNVIQLKNNAIPKGMISFEILFDSNDLCIAKKLSLQTKSHKEVEIDIRKRIKIGLESTYEE